MVDQELPDGITDEQRKFKRFDIYLVVEIKSIDRPHQSSLGIIRDFSYDGFSFEFHAPDFTLQDNIEFTLRYLPGNLSVTFSGDLIWKEQGYTECLIGIKLRTMDQETKNKYIEIISASGNMPLDLENYEKEIAGAIYDGEEKAAEEPVTESEVKSEEEEIVADEPVALLESKTDEEEQAAEEPVTVPETRIDEEEITADEPVALLESKTDEEEQAPEEPVTVPEERIEEEEIVAEEPVEVPEVKLEKEEQAAEEPVTEPEVKLAEEEISVEEPVTVPRAISALKTPQKVKRSKSGLYLLVAAIVIIALTVLSYNLVINREKGTGHPVVAVTKPIEKKAVGQAEKVEKVEQIEKVEKIDQVEKTEQVQKLDEVDDKKRYDFKSIYTIQTGSFTEPAPAYKQFDMLVNRLNKEELGFLRIEKIGRYYSVRFGKFDNHASAKQFVSEIAPRISGAIVLNANIENDRIKKFHE